ncbi:MAG: helix-turn-helix domain-containing protein [Clostridiales bacterium]|nr:helix-turn-helix domain-containing protein [Clostridiales bacterium]
MDKAYRFRLYPNKKQEIQLAKTFLTNLKTSCLGLEK